MNLVSILIISFAVIGQLSEANVRGSSVVEKDLSLSLKERQALDAVRFHYSNPT
jgi:hypothetical protein